MPFIFMKTLPQKIRVHKLTGIRVERPEEHHHSECYECLLGNPDHVYQDWDNALEVDLHEFTRTDMY